MTIPVGDSEGCTTVSLTVDSMVEGTQAFSVSIQGASPPTILFNTTEQLMIEIKDINGSAYSGSTNIQYIS